MGQQDPGAKLGWTVSTIKQHREPGDLCRPRQRQALLRWAYDGRRI
jgi:hypothetical protein